MAGVTISVIKMWVQRVWDCVHLQW